jgi:two-component system, LytTR family, response regulator AlgR
VIPSIFIVDDEAPARARLKTLLSDIAQDCPHRLAGEAADAQSAALAIAVCNPDIVLLDVQMPGKTGIDLARQLSTLGERAPAVIFVSAYDEYALKAFDVHAFDYLLKPVRAARLAEAIGRVMRIRPLSAAPGSADAAARKHFSVQERGRVLMVPVTEVIYLKAELKYVTLRTREREHLLEESLLSIEEDLPGIFVRVHRNALVARSAIIGVERAAVTMEIEPEGGKPQEIWQVILHGVTDRLPISRRQWPIIKALVR